MQIARELGIEVIETTIQRAALYLADEVFFTGTAAEITPIRSVDRITVGAGHRGEVTKRLQDEFFKIINGGTRSSVRCKMADVCPRRG